MHRDVWCAAAAIKHWDVTIMKSAWKNEIRRAESVVCILQGWICNSSICMTRRGMKPTGIAIFEAQQKGFPSVAHFVQVHCAHLNPSPNRKPLPSCMILLAFLSML
jgi:hypothetical protein